MGVDFSIVPTSGAPLISKVSWPHEKIDLLISLAGLQKCQQVPKIDPYRDQRIDYRDVKTWIEELRAIRCLYLDHRLEDLLRRNPRRTQAARV